MDETAPTEAAPEEPKHAVLAIGNLTVDLDTKRVTVDEARIHLTNRQYQILELLALRRDTVITKEAFLNHLYGGGDEPDQKTIDVFICKLRKILNGASSTAHIVTVWGRGYKLTDSDDQC